MTTRELHILANQIRFISMGIIREISYEKNVIRRDSSLYL